MTTEENTNEHGQNATQRGAGGNNTKNTRTRPGLLDVLPFQIAPNAAHSARQQTPPAAAAPPLAVVLNPDVVVRCDNSDLDNYKIVLPKRRPRKMDDSVGSGSSTGADVFFEASAVPLTTTIELQDWPNLPSYRPVYAPDLLHEVLVSLPPIVLVELVPRMNAPLQKNLVLDLSTLAATLLPLSYGPLGNMMEFDADDFNDEAALLNLLADEIALVDKPVPQYTLSEEQYYEKYPFARYSTPKPPPRTDEGSEAEFVDLDDVYLSIYQ